MPKRHLVTVGDQTHSITEWSAITGLSFPALSYRASRCPDKFLSPLRSFRTSYKPSIDKLGTTPREGDLLRCLRRGLRDKETAVELGLTPNTVKKEIFNMTQKYHRNRMQLAVDGVGGVRVEGAVE